MTIVFIYATRCSNCLLPIVYNHDVSHALCDTAPLWLILKVRFANWVRVLYCISLSPPVSPSCEKTEPIHPWSRMGVAQNTPKDRQRWMRRLPESSIRPGSSQCQRLPTSGLVSSASRTVLTCDLCRICCSLRYTILSGVLLVLFCFCFLAFVSYHLLRRCAYGERWSLCVAATRI